MTEQQQHTKATISLFDFHYVQTEIAYEYMFKHFKRNPETRDGSLSYDITDEDVDKLCEYLVNYIEEVNPDGMRETSFKIEACYYDDKGYYRTYKHERMQKSYDNKYESIILCHPRNQ